MRSMTEKQQKLLSLLDAVPVTATGSQRFNPRPEHMGRGFTMRIKRLYIYRGKYLAFVWAQLRKRMRFGADAGLPARTFWGRIFMLPAHDKNARIIRETGKLGGAEDALSRFLICSLTEADVFYDIGANYGFYSALAQEIIVHGEVHVFEPSPSIFQYLQQIKKDSACRMYLNNVALTERSGAVDFFDCASDEASGKSTTVEAVALGPHRRNCRKVSVCGLTLDEYSAKHATPTFIKLDVEGAELQVLLGGARLLKRTAPTIAIELWSGEDLSQYSLKVLDFLEPLGYVPFRILPDGDLEKTGYPHLRAWLPGARAEVNFVFRKVIEKLP